MGRSPERTARLHFRAARAPWKNENGSGPLKCWETRASGRSKCAAAFDHERLQSSCAANLACCSGCARNFSCGPSRFSLRESYDIARRRGCSFSFASRFAREERNGRDHSCFARSRHFAGYSRRIARQFSYQCGDHGGHGRFCKRRAPPLQRGLASSSPL